MIKAAASAPATRCSGMPPGFDAALMKAVPRTGPARTRARGPRRRLPERRPEGAKPGNAAPVAGEVADEDPDGDQWTRRGLAESERIDHLAIGDPAISRYGTLPDVGEDRVGAAEREQAHLEEEGADVE